MVLVVDKMSTTKKSIALSERCQAGTFHIVMTVSVSGQNDHLPLWVTKKRLMISHKPPADRLFRYKSGSASGSKYHFDTFGKCAESN